MPPPTIQRSWIEVGGNPASASTMVDYANYTNKFATTWARMRCPIMRIAGRGGPSVPAYEMGVHSGMPPLKVSFSPLSVPYPFYTHSMEFPSAWTGARLFRVAMWPRGIGFYGWEGTMGFTGPYCYTFYNPQPNYPDNLRLFLEAYNMPSDPYYNNYTGDMDPNPYGAYSGLDNSEVQAYWVGATVETSVGNFSLTYDALDADSNTSQNTGTQINYGQTVTINKVDI